MPLIAISYPMPGAQVGRDFVVCGTYTCAVGGPPGGPPGPPPPSYPSAPGGVTITVQINNFQAQEVKLCPGHEGHWQAVFQQAPVGNNQVLTATLNCPSGTASVSVESVDVVQDPPISTVPVCCEPPEPPPPPPLPPMETVAGKPFPPVTLTGTFRGPATELIALPQQLLEELSTDPATGHTHLRYRPGRLAPGTGVVLVLAADGGQWELRAPIAPGCFFYLILKDRDRIVGWHASRRF